MTGLKIFQLRIKTKRGKTRYWEIDLIGFHREKKGLNLPIEIK